MSGLNPATTHDRSRPATGDPRKRRRRVRTGLVGVILLALVSMGVAACGDDTTDSGDESTTTTTGMSETTTSAMDETTTTSGTDETTTTDESGEPSSEVADTLSDSLVGEGVDILLSVVDVADFTSLTDADQLTIFAPTDDAFTSVPADELAALVTDPAQVDEVLGAHVVEGFVASTDLTDGQEIETLGGETVTVSIDDDGTVMIGDATIVEPDVSFDGGIVHVIDAVLALPEA